ncbi:uncharacterized protein [Ptychodera flava]|uniref:uncharacterized protein isoform X3 n=1 Tax=Ptychodera flava TaxID=63121 RepID=UPI00396AAC12
MSDLNAQCRGDVVDKFEVVSLEGRDYCGEGDGTIDTEGHNGRHRYPECLPYKTATCTDPAKCGARHPHIYFPPAFDWESQHMMRLGFSSQSVTSVDDCGSSLPFEEIVNNWLMENPRHVLTHLLPDYPVTAEVEEYVAEVGMEIPEYRQLLSSCIKESIQQDDFMQVLTEFAEKYDMKKALIKVLCKAACKSILPRYRKALLRWIVTVDEYRSGTLHEAFLDHFLADIVEVAAQETDITVVMNQRAATARKIVICGKSVDVESDVDVLAPDGGGVLHIATCVKKEPHARPTDITKLLSQAVCEALAVASKSPFGNDQYKTVYQILVCAVRSNNTDVLQFSIVLVKCSVSVQTLDSMTQCPIRNPLRPSYIMHTKFECPQLHMPGFPLVFYRAVKAVLIAFKGINTCEHSD